jgi:hypothetical protein
MPFTDYALDKFMAHKLSELTECGAKDIPIQEGWLNQFLLNRVTAVHGDSIHPQYATTLLRRTEGAFWSYRLARKELIAFVQGDRHVVVSPYFRALLGFKICVSECSQAFDIFKVASGKPDLLFKKGDETLLARLNCLYNTSKHMADRIKKGEIPPEATSAIWLTNTGLESKNTVLSFDELLELLLELANTAAQIIGRRA